MAKTNHNEALRVRTALKAGYIRLPNHNEALRVRSAIKAGILRLPAGNHNEALRVRSALKAGYVNPRGGIILNHNEALRVRSAPLKAGFVRASRDATADTK
jgi:hypothetical protein